MRITLLELPKKRSERKKDSGLTQMIVGLDKNPLFCFFKARYYFYMKTMEESQHCYYNTTFATIPIFEVEDNIPKNMTTLEPNEIKLCYSVRKTPSVLECKQENIRNDNDSALFLTSNYFDSSNDCGKVIVNLNKYWGTVSDIVNEPHLVFKVPMFALLDQHFVTTTVRGGGNCLYLAFNELS